MKTVIMAGGKGTRIAALYPDIPKPLIPIKNADDISKPVLQWEIESLRDQGFTDIILTVGYLADKIIALFGDGSKFGVHIEYYVEEKPLGNAGALFKLGLEEDFLLLIADAMFDVDFNRMVRFHHSHNALVTLFTHPNSHPYDSSVLVADDNNAVTKWLTKEDERPEFYQNRVNAGLQVISPTALSMSGIDPDTIGTEKDGKIVKVDMDRQILKPLCGTGLMFCYDSPEYCKDMGTPERFEQVSKDFQSGTVKAKNLKNKQRAIFLDRDGTINQLVGFLRKPEEFKLLDGAAEAIRLINSSGYLAIIITNQPVIARGEVTTEQLQTIHNKMETLLGAEGAYIDGLYYCPHHPHKGYEGEIPELKIDCECRKPKIGLLKNAAERFNIDLSRSWFIGDTTMDIQTGINAGTKTVLVKTGEAGKDGKFKAEPDFEAESLLEAVKLITKEQGAFPLRE